MSCGVPQGWVLAPVELRIRLGATGTSPGANADDTLVKVRGEIKIIEIID